MECPTIGVISTTNKAFKSDSQRLAVSLRSSIAKRRSHLNAALCFKDKNETISFYEFSIFDWVCR
ncbi:hypothetical protein FR279_21435 [Vibrio vulnificus]|nr:hypothetical protein [Vibrio vulnificus]RZR32517.1 hypothetical protein D8T59_22510 [Vibrio vulnificus]